MMRHAKREDVRVGNPDALSNQAHRGSNARAPLTQQVAMKRFDIRAAVDEELARFEEEVRTLAYAIARAVLREELESKPLQLVLKPLPATTGRQAKRLKDEPDEPIAARAESKATRRRRAELADEPEPVA